MTRPPRPKKGSFATTGRASRATARKHVQSALDPVVAVPERLRGSAQPDVFVHSEDLHARGVDRRLVTEHERAQVDRAALLREHARGRRIERIARRRRHHHLGRPQRRAPVLAHRPLAHQLEMVLVRAHERVHRAHEVRKRLQVVHALIVRAAHQRREPHHLRAELRPRARHVLVEALDDVLEHAAQPIHAGHAGGDQEPGVEQRGTIGLMSGVVRLVHPIYASLCARSSVAL